MKNKQASKQTNKQIYLIAFSESFTGFPLSCTYHYIKSLALQLMLEIECIYPYESSQLTNVCISFSLSTGAKSKAYHDLNNENLQRKLQEKSI